jgi:inosose dehydratase
MRRRWCVMLLAGSMLIVTGVTPALGLRREQPYGAWPTSWPIALDAYRADATTHDLAAGNQETWFEIPVKSPADFDRIWPAVLAVRSEGAPITLRAGDEPKVIVKAPAYDATLELPNGKRLDSGPPWPDSARLPDGRLPEYVAVEGGRWVPTERDARKGFMFRARVELELVADGRIVDLNRTFLPQDAPIVDQRAVPTSQPAYGPRIAVQLYAWTQDRRRQGKDFWEDLDAVLGEVKATGIPAIEGWLDWFSDRQRTERATKLIRKHGLEVAGLYTGGPFHEPEAAEQTVKRIVEWAGRAYAIRPTYISVNPDPLPGKAEKTEAQVATQVRYLDELGRRLSPLGCRLLIHEHDPAILHDAREYRYNVKHLDPRYVGLCLDTHWVYRGGEDPLTLLKEGRPLVQAMHLRNSRDGVWTESFGPGDVDYEAIAAYLRETRYTGWLVLELAFEPKTTFTQGIVQNHAQGYAYLRKVFLGE